MGLEISVFGSVNDPEALVQVSGCHEIESMRRINRLLDQPHEFQIESDELVIILISLLKADGRSKLLNGGHFLRQVFEVDENFCVVETFGKVGVERPAFDARSALAIEEVLGGQLQPAFIRRELGVGRVVAVGDLGVGTG